MTSRIIPSFFTLHSAKPLIRAHAIISLNIQCFEKNSVKLRILRDETWDWFPWLRLSQDACTGQMLLEHNSYNSHLHARGSLARSHLPARFSRARKRSTLNSPVTLMNPRSGPIDHRHAACLLEPQESPDKLLNWYPADLRRFAFAKSTSRWPLKLICALSFRSGESSVRE